MASRLRRSIVGVGIAAAALLASAAAAEAVTYEVDTTSDSSLTACTAAATDCSLRGAISNSNASPAVNDIVTFPTVTGTIALGSELLVTDSVVINGPGPAVLTLSGQDNTRILRFDMATSGEAATVQDLTLADGDSIAGGAIRNQDAALTVANSVLVGNRSTSAGGAIVHDGQDAAQGANNIIVNALITGNLAENGGGIYAAQSIGVVDNSTIVSNDAINPAVIGSLYEGGGIFASAGTVRNSTVSGNYAEMGGGGINVPFGKSLTLNNSVVANNSRGTGTSFGPDVNGVYNVSFSLIESTVGNPATINPTVAGSVLTGVDPQLSALGDFGGEMQTMRPSACSPVIDQGGNTAALVSNDQRGQTRINDLPGVPNSAATGANGADMGSVELTAAEATAPCTPTGGHPPDNPPNTPPVESVPNVPGPTAPPPQACKKKKKKKGKKSASAAAKCKKKKKKKK